MRRTGSISRPAEFVPTGHTKCLAVHRRQDDETSPVSLYQDYNYHIIPGTAGMRDITERALNRPPAVDCHRKERLKRSPRKTGTWDMRRTGSISRPAKFVPTEHDVTIERNYATKQEYRTRSQSIHLGRHDGFILFARFLHARLWGSCG